MFQKIIHFIKYHNAFTIGLMVVFIGVSASLAASPEVREAFVSSQETVLSIDNSGILAANLDNFDFNLQIKAVTEDERAYLISYSYKTMAINDYVWQEVFKEGELNVSKLALAGNDLGLYVAEQLSQLINRQLAYLKEVQTIEKEKGLSQKVATVEYAGLIGRFLSPQEITFPGYEPVIPAAALSSGSEISTEAGGSPASDSQAPQQVVQQITIQQTIDPEMIRQIVMEMLAQQPASAPDGASAGEQAPAPPAPPVPSDIEGSPVEGPPAEQPPAEQPPAVEQPPAEQPPAVEQPPTEQLAPSAVEGPPAEQPPAEATPPAPSPVEGPAEQPAPEPEPTL